jgi:hypothetical protein
MPSERLTPVDDLPPVVVSPGFNRLVADRTPYLGNNRFLTRARAL